MKLLASQSPGAANSARINTIFRRVVPHVTHRALRVFDGRWIRKARAGTVRDRKHGVARRAQCVDPGLTLRRVLERLRVLRQGRMPATAVDIQNTYAFRSVKFMTSTSDKINM